MTTAEFIKVKKTAHTPQFRDIIGLKEIDNKCSFLIEFCTLLHPNQCKIGQGSKVQVFTDKGHYIYTLYNSCIIRTVVETGKKTMYKLS